MQWPLRERMQWRRRLVAKASQTEDEVAAKGLADLAPALSRQRRASRQKQQVTNVLSELELADLGIRQSIRGNLCEEMFNLSGTLMGMEDR